LGKYGNFDAAFQRIEGSRVCLSFGQKLPNPITVVALYDQVENRQSNGIIATARHRPGTGSIQVSSAC